MLNPKSPNESFTKHFSFSSLRLKEIILCAVDAYFVIGYTNTQATLNSYETRIFCAIQHNLKADFLCTPRSIKFSVFPVLFL